MRIINNIIILLLLSFFGYAQEDTLVYEEEEVWDEGFTNDELKNLNTAHLDSAEVIIRSFNATKLSELKSDPELNYSYSKASMTLWDMFWQWIGELFSEMFQGSGNANWMDIITYAVVITILVYVIMRLLKIDSLKIFYGSDAKKKLEHLVIEENIHEMDFEKLIADAISKSEYRVAIRLLFLFGLKMLADKQHIHWEPGKTNHDYVSELNVRELKKEFNQLNYYFEYAWYGNFTITNETFVKVNAIFTDWRTKI